MPASRSPRAMSTSQFERLTYTVREANKHQAVVAAATRAVISCTHHARSRAHKLGLTINVKDAVACPHRFVAALPLPILEGATCPQPVVGPRPKLSLVVPRSQADAPVSGPFSTISISAEPINIRAWPVLMPRLSILPDDLFTLAPRRAPEPPVIPVIPDVPFDEEEADAFFASHELGYPASGAADYAESSSSLSDGSSVSSGSSSSGPVTPHDAEMTLESTLPSKRRLEPEVVVDKRPKYDRKAWTRDPVRSF